MCEEIHGRHFIGVGIFVNFFLGHPVEDDEILLNVKEKYMDMNIE